MKRLAVVLALLAAALSGGAGRSQAVFVASSANAGNSFATAALFNAVSVTLADPGTPLRGTVALSATATSDRPIVSVRFQSAPAGSGSWTDRCTDTVAPYSCSWDTTALADGLNDLRAIALDASSYSQTATVIDRRVDNTPPTLTMTDPGSPLTGTRTIAATAGDPGGTGVASVAFEYRTSPAGLWTPVCNDAGSPYSCPWSTALLADGLYDLRATATDAAGNTSSSTVTDRRLDNTAPTVSMTDDGTPKRSTVTLQSTSGDGNGAGVASVRYQFRPSGGGAWTDACTGSSAPFSCPVDTTAAPDGLYDMRAIATDGAGFQTTSAALAAVRIDNTNPSSATITNPGSPLSGTAILSGTGADAGSGLASMRFEYRTTGVGLWTTVCTDGSAPFSCGWDTTSIADGSYDLRAVAIDGAGNTRNSASVNARIVDNQGPAVTVTNPGLRLRGTPAIGATATDASGVQSVAIQYAPAGSGSFTPICSDTSSPYSCPWNVTALADGNYDLRAIATDTLGRQTTSAVVTTSVDNTSPSGTDVQTTNGGTNDRIDAGDAIVFTYSEAMAPGSILAGWNGSAAGVTVRVLNNGALDRIELYDAADTTPLNLLAPAAPLELGGNFTTSTVARFSATITQVGNTIRVTMVALVGGTVRSTASGSQAMVWKPSEAATNPAGKLCMPTTVTESGAADVDF
ncbi:MAG: Ig-like domain-containing protein [Solirubrobacteraceae bacterium]